MKKLINPSVKKSAYLYECTTQWWNGQCWGCGTLTGGFAGVCCRWKCGTESGATHCGQCY